MCKIIGKVNPNTLKKRVAERQKRESRARRVRVTNREFSRKVREETWGKLQELKNSEEFSGAKADPPPQKIRQSKTAESHAGYKLDHGKQRSL